MKKIIQTEDAPQAIGPYVQATAVDMTEVRGLISVSGQIALDPKTSELVGKTAAEQMEQVMKNLAAILKAARSSFAHVLKARVYVTDIAAYPEVNAIYAKHVGKDLPARAVVGVKELPKGALVEAEMEAYEPKTQTT